MKEQSLSILFPGQEEVLYRKLPDTVWHDLGLDAVVEKVAQRPEEAELIRRVMTGLTADPAVSAFRCDVFRDILNHPEIRERMMKLLPCRPTISARRVTVPRVRVSGPSCHFFLLPIRQSHWQLARCWKLS